MAEMNGTEVVNDLDELQALAERDAQRMAAREPSVHVQELLTPSALPFDQKAHDLLLKSIDQVTTDWITELEHVRRNSKQVEQLVMERAAKIRIDITKLFLLGAAAQAEALRGDEVNHQLAGELDKLIEHP
jgi:hypothetical protein